MSFFSENINWDRNLGNPFLLTDVRVNRNTLASRAANPSRPAQGIVLREHYAWRCLPGGLLQHQKKSLIKNCAGFFFRAKQRGEELHFTHDPCHVVAMGAIGSHIRCPVKLTHLTFTMGPHIKALIMGGSFCLLEWHLMVSEAVVKNLEEMLMEKHGALHDWPFGASKTEPPSLLLPCFKGKEFHTRAGPISVNKNILLDSAQSWKTYMTNIQELATFQSSRRWCQVPRNRRRYHSPTARMHSCPKCFRLQEPWAYCGWCPGGKTSKKKASRWESALGFLPLSTFTKNSGHSLKKNHAFWYFRRYKQKHM